MANTHIISGRVKNGFVIDAVSIQSQTIANNTVSANTDPTYNFVSVTALGGNTWVSFAPANGVANAANVSNRIYLVNGTTLDFGANGSIKIHVLDG